MMKHFKILRMLTTSKIQTRNNQLKTLVIHNGIIKGVTEEMLQVGDVVCLDESEPLPLLVSLIQVRPSKVGFNPDADPNQLITPDDEQTPNAVDVDVDWEGDFDRVAYLSYNEKASSKYVKKTSQRLEKRMAKTFGGRTTPGSGAFSGHKGDINSTEWLGEHKYTDGKSYRFQNIIWEKIAREAQQVNKRPAFEVILDQDASHLRLIFITLGDFCEKTGIKAEEDLVAYFHFKLMKPKTGKASVNLANDELQSFINEVLGTDDMRVPGILLSWSDKDILIGMLAKDFELIFPAPVVEKKPKPKAPTRKFQQQAYKRPPAPKKAWPKRPFPTRKKKENPTDD